MNLLNSLIKIKGNGSKGDARAARDGDTLSPLTNPATGARLPERVQPGYYPGFSTMAQSPYWDDATRTLIEKRLMETPPIRFFTPAEERTLRAVVTRVLPQEDRIPSRRIEILPGIDERLHANRIDGYRYADMPSDQEAYRIAAAAFERMAQDRFGKAFEALSVTQQETLLRSVHHAKPMGAEELWSRMNIERFWALLVSDCCSVYYAHPWAWDEIGFGGPAYPRGYMRLEEGEPEPWEKNEQRYEWNAPADTLSDVEEAHGAGAQHQTHPGQGGTH